MIDELMASPRHAWITASRADWIGVAMPSQPNMWIAFRKKFSVSSLDDPLIAQIACDSKYQLWINGQLLVFEGQLKRGPTPQDTYVDQIDLTPHLKIGENTLAILVCYFGRSGFSHHDSGKAALWLQAENAEVAILTDNTWRAIVHPAYGTTDPPLDNFRLSESNILFDARLDFPNWQLPSFDDESWPFATCFGKVPCGPWHQLLPRPIPPLKDSGLLDFPQSPEMPLISNGQVIRCKLPYNAHVTPFFRVRAAAGKCIQVHSDIYASYGKLPRLEVLRHEYITRDGEQDFEFPSWINGHEIHFHIPAGIEVLDLKYRETSYDTDLCGHFSCDDEQLNLLWEKAARTLVVTMRDTYMDCPDRERAQWWGDVVNEMGEAFYALDPLRTPLLARKGIYELIGWQREDGRLYSPVPTGVQTENLQARDERISDQELPQQMLASIGWYGFWTYYWYSGDSQTLIDAYPSVRKYVLLWEVSNSGLTDHRAGDWDWSDWGNHADGILIEHCWLYLALQAAHRMADLTGNSDDAEIYQNSMRAIAGGFQQNFWRGDHYRSDGHVGPIDDRAQAMVVVAGLARKDHFAAITSLLQNQKNASPYMEKYVLEALLIMQKPDIAMDRMLTRYSAMLTDGMTTLWELFDPIVLEGYEGIGRGTCNHAWSGGPLTILSQYVAGITPTSPGFETYQIAPQLGRLQHVHCIVPTQFGNIELSIHRGDQTTRIDLTSPLGTHAHLRVGHAHSAVLPPGIEKISSTSEFLEYRFPPGKWNIELTNP